MATRDQQSLKQKAKDIAQRATDINMDDAADRVSEVSERVQEGISEVNERVRSAMRDADIDETTIPDAFRKMPKFISPRVHAWLDAAVTSYFLGLGSWFAIRGRVGPAIAAFVNGGMVAGVSMFTDYDGSGKKPISFKMHGTLDAFQAATAAAAPVLHGFAGEPESAFFYGQAANELAVIAGTDWDAGMPARNTRSKKRRKAA